MTIRKELAEKLYTLSGRITKDVDNAVAAKHPCPATIFDAADKLKTVLNQIIAEQKQDEIAILASS